VEDRSRPRQMIRPHPPLPAAWLLAFIVAVGTVGSQALRAARKDLVEAPRNE